VLTAQMASQANSRGAELEGARSCSRPGRRRIVLDSDGGAGRRRRSLVLAPRTATQTEMVLDADGGAGRPALADARGPDGTACGIRARLGRRGRPGGRSPVLAGWTLTLAEIVLDSDGEPTRRTLASAIDLYVDANRCTPPRLQG
jgi:hypothetical protein